MSAWSNFRDSALSSVGIPTGIDLSAGAPVPPEAVSAAGAAAGNGIIDLATNAFSNIFRPDASVVAGSPQATANTVAKISMPILLIGGVVLFMLMRKKR